jgi:hypothetical protein
MFIFLLLIIEIIFLLKQYLNDVEFKDLDWNFLHFFSFKINKQVVSTASPLPPITNVCTFSRIDLMKKRILDKNKQVIEPSDIKYDTNGNLVSGGIDCSTCDEYTYKTIKGCNTLRYDAMYSGTGTGLCTSVGFPNKCN